MCFTREQVERIRAETAAPAELMSKRLPKTITEEQFEALLTKASRTAPTGIRNRAVLTVMWDCGLRVSEVCDLAPGDVLRRHAALRVRHGKGDRDREVPLTQSALDRVDAWLAVRGRGGPWLFCTVSGRNRLSDRYMRAMVGRYAARAGVLKTVSTNGRNRELPINPHVLRHSYATRLLRRGIDIDEVQALLGHASLQTTAIYLHVENDRLAEKVRSALSPDEPEEVVGTRAMVKAIVRDELRAELIADLRDELRNG